MTKYSTGRIRIPEDWLYRNNRTKSPDQRAVLTALAASPPALYSTPAFPRAERGTEGGGGSRSGKVGGKWIYRLVGAIGLLFVLFSFWELTGHQSRFK